MSTLVVEAESSNRGVTSISSSYATARAGGSLNVDSNAQVATGQAFFAGPQYECSETFLRFDTSPLPDDAVIDSVVLSLYGQADDSVTDFIIEARLLDWGTAVETTDWVSGANLGNYTLLASRNTSGGFSTAAYNDLTSESAFVSNVSKTGFTSLFLSSSRHRLNNTPTGLERIFAWRTPQTGKNPKLTITYHVNHQGEFNLQGVGTFSMEATARFSGQFSMQGVAGLSFEPTGVPNLDFSKYDAVLEDEDGTVGLIYFDSADIRKETVSRRLQAERQDTGLNPNETRPESGNFFGQGDFSHGAGQRYFHHQGADAKKFLRSEGFDISDPGKLTHLHDVLTALSDINVDAAAVADGQLFVASGSSVKVKNSSWPGSWTTEDQEPAEANHTVPDLTSSGEDLFAACGAGGIHKRVTAGTWSHYSDVQATRLLWAKGRLMAADGRSIYEVVSGPGAPSALETLPLGWTFDTMFEAGAFIYALAVNSNASRSEYHVFGMKSDLSGIELKGSDAFPHGQIIRSGSGYLNQILLGGGIKNADGGYDPVLYRAGPADDSGNGFLQYVKIAQEVGSGSVDLSVRAFAPFGENVVFGWSTGSGCAMGAARAGLGIFSFATEAFSWHLKATSAANAIRSVLLFEGRLVMTVLGVGVSYEDTANAIDTAVLISSVADWNNAGGKLWDQLEISHNALPAGAIVKFEYATEIPVAATTWSEAFRSQETASDGTLVRMSHLRSRLFAVKLTSTKSANGNPEIVAFSVRSNPSPEFPEFSLTRYVRLLDRDLKDDQAEEIRQDSSLVRKRLLGLAYSWIKLYEPDITWLVKVDQVGDAEPMFSEFDPGSTRDDFFIVQLVLSGTTN